MEGCFRVHFHTTLSSFKAIKPLNIITLIYVHSLTLKFTCIDWPTFLPPYLMTVWYLYNINNLVKSIDLVSTAYFLLNMYF